MLPDVGLIIANKAHGALQSFGCVLGGGSSRAMPGVLKARAELLSQGYASNGKRADPDINIRFQHTMSSALHTLRVSCMRKIGLR